MIIKKPKEKNMNKSNALIIGFIGWRGMVGNVLTHRMIEKDDFDAILREGYQIKFFSTSKQNEPLPKYLSDFAKNDGKIHNALDINSLKECNIIVSCQGGEYTSKYYPELIKSGWNGIWIDAASTLRYDSDSILVLDPLNIDAIKNGLKRGVKKFIGANCTVSLMLMACQGLFRNNLVSRVNSSTYQAASGAGAKNMVELVSQMNFLSQSINLADSALEIDKSVKLLIGDKNFPKNNFGAPLACSVIPWIDKYKANGQTKEEWKGKKEGNKIIGSSPK